VRIPPVLDQSEDPYIGPHDDPVPLLERMANLVRRGEPIPMRLAGWFLDAQATGRLQVKKVRGGRSPDSLQQHVKAIQELRKLPKKGILAAIEAVRANLNLEASVHTIEGWLLEIDKIDRETHLSWLEEEERSVIATFRSLAAQEMSQAAAFAHVWDDTRFGHVFTVDELERFQARALHNAASPAVDASVSLDQVWRKPLDSQNTSK